MLVLVLVLLDAAFCVRVERRLSSSPRPRIAFGCIFLPRLALVAAPTFLPLSSSYCLGACLFVPSTLCAPATLVPAIRPCRVCLFSSHQQRRHGAGELTSCLPPACPQAIPSHLMLTTRIKQIGATCSSTPSTTRSRTSPSSRPDTDDQMDEVDAEPEPEPRADEYDAFFKKHMPELPDHETEAQVYNTWEIRDWPNAHPARAWPSLPLRRTIRGGYSSFPFGNNVDFASFLPGARPRAARIYQTSGMPASSSCWSSGTPKIPTMYLTHTAHHRFTADEGDWGFTRFAELRRLFSNSWDDRGRPMVEDNAANVTAYLRVLKDPTGVLWHNFIK